MKKYINKIPVVAMALVLLTFAACKKEYRNASGANATDVLNSSKGLTGIAASLQRVYTAGRSGMLYNSVTANGFVTNELVLLNSGNLPEAQLTAGGATVDGTNTILSGLWANANKIIYDADNVITNTPSVISDKNYAAGLIAYASIYKALAIGNMAQYWEKIPSGTGKNVTFITRVQGFEKAIEVIDNALAVIQANPPSASALSNLPAGIDIANTLYALKARYALFSGKYDVALTSANAVDITKKSTFNFDVLTLNPINDVAASNVNVYQVVDANLGLSGAFAPNPLDNRLTFYTVTATTAPVVRIGGFGLTSTTAFPVYLTGEITLIKAEANARKTTPDLAAALTELNKVITKVPATDPFGVGANLSALTGTYTQAQLLDEIYKQRCIELYMSGLKLEDMRRFARPTSERKRNFFPYPFTERDNNTNTPADPLF
jgi:hypothetical protein